MEIDQEKCSLDIILVDPSKRTIEEKTITSDSNHGLFKEIKKLIECPWAEAITFNEERDHVYVDVEGAFRDHIKFWTIKTNFTKEPIILRNKGVICGTDHQGDEMKATETLDQIKDRIQWGLGREVKNSIFSMPEFS